MNNKEGMPSRWASTALALFVPILGLGAFAVLVVLAIVLVVGRIIEWVS